MKARAILLGLGLLLAGMTGIIARDLGQWDNIDPAEREWFKKLMRPDEPTKSCCGEGDAYWADVAEVVNGQTIAVITDDRPDGPLGRYHEDVGNRYPIPATKIKWDNDNPTGHVIIFLSGPTWWNEQHAHRDVLCYVMGSGT